MNDHVKEPNQTSAAGWLVGGGEMGKLVRSMDWSRTPLGPIESWPQSLRSPVSILLPSKAQIILFWGPELIALYNDAYRPVLGRKHPWALGKPARECWSEIWEDVLGPIFNNVLSAGEAFWAKDHQFFLERHGYVEETYFDVSYDPVRDETGKVGGIFCVVSETTGRVLSERRLQTLRDLGSRSMTEGKTPINACVSSAKTLMQNPADIPFALFYLLDKSGSRLDLCETVGLPTETALSPQSLTLTNSDSPWLIPEVVETNAPVLVEQLASTIAPLLGKSVNESPHSALVFPLSSASQQKLAGVLVAGVSPRRSLDGSYRDFLALVAGHVATAIANARAYEEERKRADALAELDRAKTAFFSNISHEFRTPLTLMLGPVEEILAKSPEQVLSENRELLTVVYRNGLRLQKLVNTLLDFARIEAGRMEAVYEETDLAVFTAELASVFRSAIEKAGLKLIIECPPLPEPAYVDRQMWEKIVFNLLSNAFKFTFEGEIEVALRWRREWVELSVRDTGVGITTDELPRIFERFHRVLNVRSRTYEGTGIGLTLVQELARLHGGDVIVQSSFGRGSTFTVTIETGTAHLSKERIGAARTMVSTAVGASPFVEEAMQWLPSAEDGERGRNGEGENGRDGEGEKGEWVSLSARLPVSRARILVADDNADMREYARRLLLQQGYHVTAVPDGEAALAVAREQKPDLVLADVMMPRLDGFGLLRALRDDAATSTLPIILLSARSGEESRVEGFERGADDYLVKPFSARELLARVGAQLTMSQLRTAALQRERVLRVEAEKLNEVARSLTAELDLQTLVQKVTDAGTELTAAKFGAFFYNSVTEQGESYLLYTLSGAPREAFDEFGIPRNTPLFQPTFQGAGVVRIDDVLKDPRYGHNRGMLQGPLAVRSYLAVPVISRFGQVLGGLFFGHPEPAVFTEHAERLALGIAAQAAIAIDNAELHQQAKKEIEERARVETALREREERYELVLAGAEAAIWDWDVPAKRVVFSPRWKELRGLSDAEVSDREEEWTNRIHPDDFERVMAAVRNHFEGRTPVFAEEYRVRHKDGRWIWILDRGIARRDAAGRVIRMAGSETDITERKRAEESLAEAMRQKEALYQLVERRQRAKSLEEIYDTALDAILSALRCERASILLCDDSGVMRFVAWRGLSDGYRKSTEGHSPWKKEEPNPQPICVPDIAASDLDDSLKAVVTGEGIRALAFIPLVINKRLAGKFMIYYNAPHAFGDEELDLSLTIAGQLALGIERMRAEQALRESQAHLRLTTEAAEVGTWQWNITTGQVFWSAIHKKLWGYEPTPEPVAYDDWACRLDSEDLKRAEVTIERCLQGREAYDVEYRMTPRGGSETLWIRSIGRTNFNEAGQAVLMQGVSFDITDRKQGQERLESIVAERTRQLQQANAALLRDMEERKKLEEQLLQAQKMESIGVLAGGIAHDFNNILNIIQGYASVLGADGSRSKQTEESLTVINESIQRGSALVQQLLTLARKSGTQRESVNVNAVIEGLIALMTQTFPKTVELSTSLHADLPSLTADKNQVEQALLNLCVNARDAMPNGGRLIFKTESVVGASLQEWSGTPEEPYLCIEVSDTGLGMDEHVRERIFEPFFTTKDKSQGTGLGLSVVYGIVKDHNGIIHVESKPDCGTTFRLYFPVSPACERPITEVTPVNPETTKEPSRWGTILLVEDEKDMLYLLEKTLLRHGYRVLTATDGEKALEVYQRHNGTIDAVLLDIGLPKMAGQEVLRRMQEQNPGVRVVIASGYLEPALKSEISEVGVQHFVDKPYRLNQVVNTLQSLIEPKSNSLT